MAKLKEYKKYYDNGQLEYHYYKDYQNRYQGEFKEYHDNGKLWHYCYYLDGKLNDKVIWYNLDGSVIRLYYYKNGIDITEKIKRLNKWKS